MKNVEIIASRPDHHQMVRDLLEKLTTAEIKAFDVDLFKLNRIVFFDNPGEIDTYEWETCQVVGSPRVFYEAHGMFKPRLRTIYLFNNNQMRSGGVVKQTMVLLHELSHYLMDSHDVSSIARYATDPIYRILEEMRVDRMSFYLAKQIMPETFCEQAKIFVQEHANMLQGELEKVRSKSTNVEKYNSNGIGICKLMDLYSIQDN